MTDDAKLLAEIDDRCTTYWAGGDCKLWSDVHLLARARDRIAALERQLAEANKRIGELEDDVHRRSKQYNELYEQLAEARKYGVCGHKRNGRMCILPPDHEEVHDEAREVPQAEVARKPSRLHIARVISGLYEYAAVPGRSPLFMDAARLIESLVQARPIPREPTEAMLRAGNEVRHGQKFSTIVDEWRAMYDAAVGRPERTPMPEAK